MAGTPGGSLTGAAGGSPAGMPSGSLPGTLGGRPAALTATGERPATATGERLATATGERLATATGERLAEIHRLLFGRFGPQGWWPARTPFEVCVGAILTQSVAWTNVERAIANLAAAGLLEPTSLLAALRSDPAGVAALIRPAGYFNAKARKLLAFVEFLHERHGGSLARLFAQPLSSARAELLTVHGVGPETADSILLYAGDLPTFVVDAYTRRVFSRLGLCPPDAAYEDLRRLFLDHLPPAPALFNEYHALIVALGKDVCLKSSPRCAVCPLRGLCPGGLLAAAAGGEATARAPGN